jgi:hypothetical protein
MFLRYYANFFFALFKLKKRDKVILHKLSADCPTDQKWKLGRTHCDILLDLHDAQPIIPSLGLDRKYIVDASLVKADVDFIRLDLAKPGDRCAQMILKRIARHTSKNVDQPVIAQLANKACSSLRAYIAITPGVASGTLV